MASLTTAQILAIARTKILERTDAVVSDETLLRYGNLAKDEMALRAPSQRDIKAASLAFAAGIATTPSDFLSFYGCKDSQVPGEGNDYRNVSLEDFRARRHDRMVCRLGPSLLAYPSTSVTLYLDYYAKPVDISASQNPTVDDALHECIAYGMVWRAFQDLQDFELSRFFQQEFESRFAAQSSALSQLEEDPQDSGAMFNAIDILGGGGPTASADRW